MKGFLILLLLAFTTCCFGELLTRIEGVTESTIRFHVENRGSSNERFLMRGTPLEGFMSNMFRIIDLTTNQELEYIGALYRRGEPTDIEYFELEGKGVHTVELDLQNIYRFETVGEYSVQIALPLYSELTGNHTITIKVLNIRKTRIAAIQGYTNCNSGNINNIQSAVSGATTEATRAYRCLQDRTCMTLSTRWFGQYSDTRYNYDRDMFSKIASYLTSREFNAYCNPSGCGNNVYGYVYPSDSTHTVYLCGLFWSIPNERINTIVHEMSHFNDLGRTNDYTYGKNSCLNLARSDPQRAYINADNVCFFSEEA